MSESDQVIVAAVQMLSDFGQVQTNCDRLETLVHQAADAGAKIVATPECSIPGYAGGDLRSIWHADGRAANPWFHLHDVASIAEPIDGPAVDRLRRLAKRRKLYLLGGLVERGDAGRYYNTAILLSPEGEIAGRYRKRWPWPAIEPAWATPGDLPSLAVSTEYGTLGVAICYDIHRVRRLYAAGDLWTLLFPAAWIDTEPPTKYLDRRFPLVATTLSCNVVFANHRLPEQTRWYGSGQSTVYRADGTVAARSSEEHADDVVIATLPRAGQGATNHTKEH